ncbi:alpha/beta hydrolase family protein [Pontibacter arcticus]|nr:prolyl oligopeptidase family serine peptidase [Pontibacter arcticus]
MPYTLRHTKTGTFFFLAMLCVWLTGCTNQEANGQTETYPKTVSRMDEFSTTKKYTKFGDESIKVWNEKIPEVEQVEITSTYDGKKEPALIYTSNTPKKKPLLVILHSWSSGYLQQASIPYALWAKKYDWVFLQPNYRGKFDHPESTGSEMAIQDIVDAVNFAKGNAEIDPSRIYVVGSSGGAMSALLVAARHPNIWAGVVAWVPIYDLADWYTFNKQYPHRNYNNQLLSSICGEPLPGTKAGREAIRRSPSTYMHLAKDVPIFIAQGNIDPLVSPAHAVRAYNALADTADQISGEQIMHLLVEKTTPPDLVTDNPDSTFFGPKDPKVIFMKESGNVRLVMFEGVHDMAYNPTLLWLNQQRKKLQENTQ